MRKFFWLFAVMIGLVLGSAPAAFAYEPDEGGTFNDPHWSGYDAKWRIMRKVDAAIENTRAGETILIATYLLDRRASVTRLIDACKRDVSVRVIMDEDIDNKNARLLYNTLNADNIKDENKDGISDDNNGDGIPDPPKAGPCNTAMTIPAEPGVSARREVGPRTMTDEQLMTSFDTTTDESVTWGADRSYAKRCNGSCRGAGGNMHSKFYVFSKTGTASNVIMVSSANLNKGGAVNGWNDMYTMKNRPASYTKYKQIHRDMTEDRRAGDDLDQIVDGPYTSRFFPMRNAGRLSDPTLKDLNKIGCSSSFGRTQIHISMFYWKGTRGDYLADKVLNLARSGCRVSIIYGAPSNDMAARLRDAARRGLIRLYDSRWDLNRDGWNELRTHAKYVLVKGRYAGDPSSHQVMTGTQNWVAGSLSRGDENSLNISLASAYNDYINNWNAIRNHSRRVP